MLTTQQIDDILDGILLGRSLGEIEKALNVKVRDFLALTDSDEALNLRYKQALTLSAFVLDSDITKILKDNIETPVNAAKNAAIKMYMDHVHKQMDARNPAIFSGKAPVNVSVPIQITTSLDLGQQRTLEGVYELRAEHISEHDIAKIPIEGVISELDQAGMAPYAGLEGPGGGPEAAEAPYLAIQAPSKDVPRDERLLQEARGQGEEPNPAKSPRPIRKVGRPKTLNEKMGPQKPGEQAGISQKVGGQEPGQRT